MPRKLLRYSLTALAAIALVATSVSSSAQAQKSYKAGQTVNPSQAKARGFIGRNDGYVQQSTSTVKPAGLYGVSDLAQRSYKPNRVDVWANIYGATVQEQVSQFGERGQTCPFRKFHPAWIRMIGQNHRMVVGDDRDPAFSRNVYHRSVQVAQPA